MQSEQKSIVWFKEVSKNDVAVAGGKGANLGEMTNAGIPVPPGFIVTADAYFKFIEEAGLSNQISAFLRVVNPDDSKQLIKISTEIKNAITSAKMPVALAEKIKTQL